MNRVSNLNEIQFINLFYFFSVSCLRHIFLYQGHEDMPMHSSKSLSIHDSLQIKFVYDLSWESGFIFVHMIFNLSGTIYWKDQFLPIEYKSFCCNVTVCVTLFLSSILLVFLFFWFVYLSLHQPIS